MFFKIPPVWNISTKIKTILDNFFWVFTLEKENLYLKNRVYLVHDQISFTTFDPDKWKVLFKVLWELILGVRLKRNSEGLHTFIAKRKFPIITFYTNEDQGIFSSYFVDI